jgi:transposase
MEISVNRAMPDDRNSQVIEPLDVRPLRGRRGWSTEIKARLVEESLAPGANVSAIARREGMAPSQLFGWRRKLLASRQIGTASQTTAGGALQFARVETKPSGVVEVVVGGVVLRAGCDVDADHLAKVIRAVRLA